MSSPPPPPPPSTQMEDSEASAVVKEEVVAVVNVLEVPIAEHLEPKPDETGNEASPQLLLPPPPGPPVSRVSSAVQTHGSGLVTSTTNIDNQNHDQNEANEEVNDDQDEDVENENDDEDDEILRVTSGQNGNVMEIALSVHSSKASSQVESPIVPSVLGGHCHDSNSGSGSDQENPVSADDEGSRDGDEAGGNGNAGGPVGLCQEVSNGSVDCTPRTKKKVEHFRQGLAARRIQRTWKHFYEELEERKDVRDELPAPLVQVIEDKAKLETSGSGTVTRPETLNSPSSKCTSGLEQKPFDDDQEKAVTTIEDAFVDHQRRERVLAGMKAKIHTARPWQKKKAGGNNSGCENGTNLLHESVLEESSEEELERAYRALHLRGNDIRAKVSIIKADQELFTSGKVNEMKARLNERRSQTSKNVNERSDGITEEEDDDDDVVIY
jgi:hypothetical protein